MGKSSPSSFEFIAALFKLCRLRVVLAHKLPCSSCVLHQSYTHHLHKATSRSLAFLLPLTFWQSKGRTFLQTVRADHCLHPTRRKGGRCKPFPTGLGAQGSCQIRPSLHWRADCQRGRGHPWLQIRHPQAWVAQETASGAERCSDKQTRSTHSDGREGSSKACHSCASEGQ